jgi:predicted RNase H-like nuclease
VTQLQRKDTKKAQQFLSALELFHCQGRSMSEIAQLVELQAQFQVTRLLKLKAFRADVRQRLLLLLRDRIFEQAKAYTNPERLEALNQQIEEALDEQITTVIQEAATEASTATATKNRITSGLFAQRLCRQLDLLRTQL